MMRRPSRRANLIWLRVKTPTCASVPNAMPMTEPALQARPRPSWAWSWSSAAFVDLLRAGGGYGNEHIFGPTKISDDGIVSLLAYVQTLSE